MTLTTLAVGDRFTGDGDAVRFELSFPFFSAEELTVVEHDPASGQTIPRQLGVHYTVRGGQGASGAVIAAIAPPAGREWVVQRRTHRTQALEYQEFDPFPAQAHELALDRLQAQIQELEAEQQRSLRLSPLDEAAPPLPPLQAGYLKASTGPERLEWVQLLDPAPLSVTPFIQTLLDDSDAAAARATLGLGSGAGSVTSIDLEPAGAAAGLAFQGGPVTGAGSIAASLAIQTLDEDTTPNAASDYVATYSAAASGHRRVRLDKLPVPAVPDGGVTAPKLASQAVTAAKMAAGAAVQGGANAAAGGGQVFIERSGDDLRFRRIVVQRNVSGSGNAVADANISISSGATAITITLSITRIYIAPDGSLGGGGGGG